ncbi:MAG TPA: hypothetical protein VFO31_10100 [Vicinamibacterales bacterium]|nr:hypothetical protein [Vicinamibacterales bacterium]
MAAAGDAARDSGNLARRLAKAENDLRKALAQMAMRVDAREAQVVERRGAHGVDHAPSRLGRAGLSSPNLFKKRLKFLCRHAIKRRRLEALAI